MKSVDNKLACGVITLFYFNILSLIEIITGFIIWRKIYVSIAFCLIGFPIVFFLGHKLSKDYDEEDNHDTLFYILGFILAIVFLFLFFIISKRK
jgi:hypothetical protein